MTTTAPTNTSKANAETPPPVVEEPAAEEATVAPEPAPVEEVKVEEPETFDLDGLLTKIEEQAPDSDARRLMLANLVGVTDDTDYKKLRRQLIKGGVPAEDFASYEAFSVTKEAAAVWVAFCEHSYFNTTIEDCLKKYPDVKEVHLRTVVDANFLGLFVANWKVWPGKAQFK